MMNFTALMPLRGCVNSRSQMSNPSTGRTTGTDVGVTIYLQWCRLGSVRLCGQRRYGQGGKGTPASSRGRARWVYRTTDTDEGQRPRGRQHHQRIAIYREQFYRSLSRPSTLLVKGGCRRNDETRRQAISHGIGVMPVPFFFVSHQGQSLWHLWGR